MSFSTNCTFKRQWRIKSLLPFEKMKIIAAKANLEVTKDIQNKQKWSVSKPTVLQISHNSRSSIQLKVIHSWNRQCQACLQVLATVNNFANSQNPEHFVLISIARKVEHLPLWCTGCSFSLNVIKQIQVDITHNPYCMPDFEDINETSSPFHLDGYCEFIYHMNITCREWFAGDFCPVVFSIANHHLYV